MKRTAALGMILLTTLFGVRVQPPQKKPPSGRAVRQTRNRPPTIQSFTSSSMNVDLCPWAEWDSCGKEVILTLEVKASDPDGDALSYQYSATGGLILGDGAVVYWRLDKVGSYSATVQVTDGRGGKASATTAAVVRFCQNCDSPPCPVVNLSCPTSAVEGERIIFRSSVTGTDDKLTYSWKVTNGTIIKGEGSPMIEAEVGSSASAEVTATVTVPELDPACQREAFCRCKIQKRQP